MSKITKVVQSYHDDNYDKNGAIDAAAADMFYEICEEWGVDYPDDKQIDKFADIIRENIEASVDWKKIDEDDKNARELVEARNSALYR